MTPAVYNFTLYQGSTWRRTFTWYQDDGITPVDLTGCTAKMQGRTAGHTKPSPVGDPLFELTTEDASLVLGDTDGTTEVIIADDVSSALTFKSCQYDLEVYFPGGETQRLLQGTITMDFEVTK